MPGSLSIADVPMPSGVAAPRHCGGAEPGGNECTRVHMQSGREWNFPRIEAERTGFHPGYVEVKP